MSLDDFPRRRLPSSPFPCAAAGNGHVRHKRLRVKVYDPAGVPVKRRQPLRVRYPNLSPTRGAVCRADVALWPSWAGVPVVQLDLAAFDDSGRPVGPGKAVLS